MRLSHVQTYHSQILDFRQREITGDYREKRSNASPGWRKVNLLDP